MEKECALKVLLLGLGGHQHVGCCAGRLSVGKHGAWGKTCPDRAGTGGVFTSPAGCGKD